MVDAPDPLTNTRKLSRSLIWMYFASDAPLKSRIAYTHRKRVGLYIAGIGKTHLGMLDFVVILQTKPISFAQDTRGLEAPRNCFKKSR